MTVKGLCEALALKVLAGSSQLDGAVSACYVGDLLSWVMARCPEEGAWITVMGNVNAVAVAKLTEAACIILCEDAHLDEDARAQADQNEMPVLASGKTAFELAVQIGRMLEAER